MADRGQHIAARWMRHRQVKTRMSEQRLVLHGRHAGMYPQHHRLVAMGYVHVWYAQRDGLEFGMQLRQVAILAKPADDLGILQRISVGTRRRPITAARHQDEGIADARESPFEKWGKQGRAHKDRRS